jgi:thiamine-monophosphate kinase
MMRNYLGEKELIHIFLAELPVSQFMQNQFFESDAEVLTCGNGKMLFTTDEFSDEDHFRTDNPFRLGYNLAAATISDILAVGGIPYAYSHAVKASPLWDREYVIQLAKGIGEVLKKCEIGSIGGDIGISNQWGYTGICIGFSDNPISRKGAAEGDKIYMTGIVGAGNIEAACSIYNQQQLAGLGSQFLNNYFPVRIKESTLIGEWASSCIDTSDGVFNALNTLADINGVGYKVENLPYPIEAKPLCRMLNVPREALFMGECGEYELLFSVSPDKNEAFLKAAISDNLEFNQIGEFTNTYERLLRDGDKVWNLEKCSISARDYNSVQEYLNKLLEIFHYESIRQ